MRKHTKRGRERERKKQGQLKMKILRSCYEGSMNLFSMRNSTEKKHTFQFDRKQCSSNGCEIQEEHKKGFVRTLSN